MGKDRSTAVKARVEKTREKLKTAKGGANERTARKHVKRAQRKARQMELRAKHLANRAKKKSD
ncbi:MAG: hypothetical protein KDC38_01740 [Planctomycetes bacterium]|nr:hypothetical protein [Planctomycetota bacterium]